MARFGTYSENTSPADADLLVSVDVSDTTDDATGSTKRLSLSGLRTFFGASPTFTGTTTTAALTATGVVTVSSNNPILEMYDANGTAEQRRWRLQKLNHARRHQSRQVCDVAFAFFLDRQPLPASSPAVTWPKSEPD